MFGVGGNIAKTVPPAAGLLAPVIDSVNDIGIFVGGSGMKDGLNLSGGAVDTLLTEYTVTHFSSSDAGSRPTFPGGTWTAYTQDSGDEGIEWDPNGNVNGPLSQPTAAGPYINGSGDGPWNDFSDAWMNEIPGGGGRWKRILVTVKNAAGQDSAGVFFQPEGF